LESLLPDDELDPAIFQIFAKHLIQEQGANLVTFCDALLDLISIWFSHVWVMYEAALAQEPAILLAGDAETTLYNFYSLWSTMNVFAEDGLLRHLKSGI
jgi:hypothetical protein